MGKWRSVKRVGNLIVFEVPTHRTVLKHQKTMLDVGFSIYWTFGWLFKEKHILKPHPGVVFVHYIWNFLTFENGHIRIIVHTSSKVPLTAQGLVGFGFPVPKTTHINFCITMSNFLVRSWKIRFFQPKNYLYFYYDKVSNSTSKQMFLKPTRVLVLLDEGSVAARSYKKQWLHCHIGIYNNIIIKI